MAESTTSPLNSTEALTTLFALGREVTSVLDLQELLQKIPQLIARLTKFTAFAVYLLDPKRDELTIAYSVGYPEDVARTLRVKVGEGLVGAAVKEGRPLLVNDVHADPRYVEAVPGSNAVSVLALVSWSRSVGVPSASPFAIPCSANVFVQSTSLVHAQVLYATRWPSRDADATGPSPPTSGDDAGVARRCACAARSGFVPAGLESWSPETYTPGAAGAPCETWSGPLGGVSAAAGKSPAASVAPVTPSTVSRPNSDRSLRPGKALLTASSSR